MNSLFSKQGTWVGDGSKDSAIIIDDEKSTIIITSKTEMAPFNVILNISSLENSFYYEITLSSLNGTISAGLVNKNDFRPGWDTDGLFYNGNVHNGKTALITGFGDETVRAGDKVGVYAKRHDPDSELVVAYYINGRCLGTGFRLTSLDADDDFFPCLSVCGSATFSYAAPEILPLVVIRKQPIYTDYTGEWKLVRVFMGPELGEYPLPSDRDIIFSFGDLIDDNVYPFSVSMMNTLSGTVKLNNNVFESFDGVEIEMVSSTLMMPPPLWQGVESTITSSLSDVYKMIVSNGLILSGPTAEFILEPYAPFFEPCTAYKTGCH
eukprot:CAMPEP_0172490932 /NCGR_PEP_ID=MMETSP1066-20121228/21565_1 /TAXON_ID=671091 /ORGANISM="Coscinodiscus wailesii, Strain CCMP2513" /LENGTH=321 /DNA_ID=CAMNT_0013259677 /DNA_START=27 /DNA_END=992 /DNA_ORIENTATION=+